MRRANEKSQQQNINSEIGHRKSQVFEKLKDEKLKTIRLFVENFSKINKASNPTHVAGVAKQTNVPNKSWADMDENERRAYYTEVAKAGGTTVRK